tara:strand:- start:13459 stop:13923 length:465 start_codon:yes stop_codon:yes gene_type:complete
MFDVPTAVWGITLVDCTPTGVTRGDSIERNQQRNWDTILQTIGILTQPIVLESPLHDTFTNKDIMKGSVLYKILGTRYKFEFEMLKPSLNFWTFAIGSEHQGVFGKKLERLHDVFDMIPVVPNLNNTIDLLPSVFHTKDSEHINIQFFEAVTVA